MVELTISRRTRSTPFTSRVFKLGLQSATVYNNTILPTAIRGMEQDYAHLKKHVQIWDVGCERQVELCGKDAAWLTQYLTPRNLSKAKIGQGLYAPLVDELGGIVNDPIILKLAEDRFWLSIASGDVLLWVKGLAAGMKCDLQVTEPPVTPLAIQGPKSDALMSKVFGVSVTQLKFFWFDYFMLGDYRYMVAKSGWSKQGGYEIYVDDTEAGQFLYDTLWHAGQEFNIYAGCPNGIERIEAGLLSYGNDITLENNPFECGLDNYCNWTENTEFLGRPALEKIRSEGAKQRLIAVQFVASSCPSVATTWLAKDNDKIVGQINSAAFSPDFDCVVALGMVQADFTGSEIQAETPEGTLNGTIVTSPMI